VEAPVAAGPSTARSTVQEAGTRATLPKSRWPVGGGWRTRSGPGWVRAAAAALAHSATRQARPPSGAPLAGGCTGDRLQRADGGIRRVAGVLGLGTRPRWVVVAEPDARVGGPGGVTGGAGGDGRAAPARPQPAAGAHSSVPAVL
jgi:hypothetical protein